MLVGHYGVAFACRRHSHLSQRNRSVARNAAIVAFSVVFIVIQAGNTFVRRLPSDRAFAIKALIFYALFAGIAFLLQKRSEADPTKKQ